MGLAGVNRVSAKALPADLYLTLIHIAATTGKLPKLDLAGNVVEFEELTPDDRLDLLKRLMDKTVATPKAITVTSTVCDPETIAEAEVIDLETIPDDELRRLAARPK